MKFVDMFLLIVLCFFAIMLFFKLEYAPDPFDQSSQMETSESDDEKTGLSLQIEALQLIGGDPEEIKEEEFFKKHYVAQR